VFVSIEAVHRKNLAAVWCLPFLHRDHLMCDLGLGQTKQRNVLYIGLGLLSTFYYATIFLLPWSPPKYIFYFLTDSYFLIFLLF